MKTRILIVGGGFAGVKCALELQKKNIPNLHIRLISSKSNFEYHGALYRLVAGRSPLEVCLPLRDILDESRVDIIKDTVVEIDKVNRVAVGESGSTYQHDILVLALGAETDYFGIQGLEEHAWCMKTIDEALALKKHVNTVLNTCREQATSGARFAIVGAGPTGVELAGELAFYARAKAKQCGLDKKLVEIDLIERSGRILPGLDEAFAQRISRRLEKIGVRLRTNCSVASVDADTILCVGGDTIASSTTIWTAGVRANRLVDTLGVDQGKSGRIVVDDNLKIPGWDHIYVAGDVADTPYSGTAQTALSDGRYVARCIEIEESDEQIMLPDYYSGAPVYAIPVGPRWAGAQWGRSHFYGSLGWMLRRLGDWKVFINFLPLSKAFASFRSHYHSQGEDGVALQNKSINN
ncbi:MAG: NAD(P)/FAD-dependent oxidoreductase [Patescibacteria group bacterium]